MSLFMPPIEVRFTPDECDQIYKDIAGEGGHQGLLREIFAGVPSGTPIVPIEVDLLAKCEKYAYEYGSGGYQQRFKVILRAAFRSGWDGK